MSHSYIASRRGWFIYFSTMSSAPIPQVIYREPNTRNTIFHAFAEMGSLHLLYWIHGKLGEDANHILHARNYFGETSIHIAARAHRGKRAIELIKALVEFGVDLNAPERFTGVTALHETILNEDYELAEWLCKQPGIDMELKTWHGLTAYQWAFRRKNKKLMNILRTYGARCEE